MSKFNTVLTKNAALRGEIETLRIEKGKFQQIYKKNEKVLFVIELMNFKIVLFTLLHCLILYFLKHPGISRRFSFIHFYSEHCL